MRIDRLWKASSLACIILASLFLWCLPAWAFDTGYHFDLTREVLLKESFGEGAIGMAQICNYYNDGFESAKTVIADETVQALHLDDDWGNLYGPAALRDASDTHMHFDNLANYHQVSAAWERLVKGTYNGVREAERRNDAAGLLAVLGMSLHQVQDFYAHSNWAERDWGGDATWFDVPEAEKRTGEIYTHTTGTRSHDRINKDYAGRPYFERAYREAFYASWQWVCLVHSWVSNDFWARAKSHTSSGIGTEKRFIRYMSWYEGHWKGPSSKSRDDTAAIGPVYLLGANRGYIAKWKEYAPLVTADPDPGLVVPMAIVYPESQKWLKVRITRVRQTDNDLVWDINPGGEADFYAKIKVDGTEYLEAMHEDDDDISPTNWLTLSPLRPDDGHVRLEIAVWDEDCVGGGVLPSFRSGDDQCDIAHDLGRKYWFADGPPETIGSLGSVHTDGFRYGAAWYEYDGDGDETAADFTVTLEEPARRAFSAAIHLPPGQLIPLPPAAPVVADEGEWSAKADELYASWNVPATAGSEYNPVLEYQYRVIRQPGSGASTTVLNWTSAGPATHVRAAIPLQHGYTYYVEVKARNVAGWSAAGPSDGITVDLRPPAVTIREFSQVTATNLQVFSWKAGRPRPIEPAPTGTVVNYPNSFRISLEGQDEGSGIESYKLWITEQLSPAPAGGTAGSSALQSPAGGSLFTSAVELFADRLLPSHLYPLSLTVFTTDFKPADLQNGALVLRDLPYLRDGRTYTLKLQARDRAGNTGGAATATCVVHFTNTTPPPAPQPRVINTTPLKVSWEEVRDSESGIAEYQVAAGSRLASMEAPDLLSWRTVGRNLEYENPAVSLPSPVLLGPAWQVWVKAINGVGQESVRVVYGQPRAIVVEPKPTVPRIGPPDVTLVVGDKVLMADVPPVIEENRLLVPLRALFEALGASVTWDEKTRTVTGQKGSRTVALRIGEKVGYVDGKAVALDVPSKIVNGRTLVPVRFISESLGAKVAWDAATRTATVTL
ncbi:MAG: copper amine oxidase N-terminal domain-containing protein [Bacillota bacterium]